MQEILDNVDGYSDTIYAFTVGSEGLYRYEQSKNKVGYTSEDLLRRIDAFKEKIRAPPYNLPQRVGTADSWNKYQDGTADGLISGGVDLLYVSKHHRTRYFADEFAGLLMHLVIGNHKTLAMQATPIWTICSKPMAAYSQLANPLPALSSGMVRLVGRPMVN